MKQLMTGNEAVARGAYEAGVLFASAYPGTPSTEILENLAQYKDKVYSEWAPNEKVALEAAFGASLAGARAMAAMKHVGLNVAADPLFTIAYTGVNGGCVVISADDPGMHSSQNEQDNRNYAVAAKVPMLEPSNSQEAKDFMKLAFELSERFDTPVLLRLTTRICHSKGLVELGEREDRKLIPYQHNIPKYVATPANAKVLRKNLVERLKRLADYSNEADVNQPEYNETKIGVVSSGVAYQYAREVFGEEASYLKLGLTYPMPMNVIKEFAQKVEQLYVIEEMDPYIENHLKMAGIDCIGKAIIPEYDELNTDIVRKAVFGTEAKALKTENEAVVRPPVLCAGCPHRGIYYTLSKKKNLIVTGDIGCYTLGAAPPLSAMHTCICMGASISSGHGASTVLSREGSDWKVASIIGDSTFFHSGITSLIDVVYNRGNTLTIILDNRVTAMTGHQENPGTGFTLMGESAVEVDLPLMCKAIGIKDENLYIINPLHLEESSKVVDEALTKDEPTVIIAKWPCALKKFTEQDKKDFDLSPKKCEIDQEKCTKCKMCVKTGCPAIYSGDKITVDPEACTGCAVCQQVCPFDAVKGV